MTDPKNPDGWPDRITVNGVDFVPAAPVAALAEARAQGMREAARIVAGMKKCPFEDPKFTMDPATPCPVCRDRGDDLNAPVHCNDPAAAILAALPDAPDA